MEALCLSPAWQYGSAFQIWLFLDARFTVAHGILAWEPIHSAEMLLIIYPNMKAPSSKQGLVQGEQVTTAATHMVPIGAALRQITVPHVLIITMPPL